MKRIINERLAHFKNEEDRNDAITMLVFVGLKHHSIMYPHEKLLRKQSLKTLCDKYYQEHTVQNISKLAHDDSHQKSMSRKHRPDAMFHYPFADDYGSVPDVLLSAPEERPKLLEIGGPARKRLIERVFEEMRLDRNGIRLSDLPEALDRLGITISGKLRRLLARTRSNLVNGPIRPGDADGYDGDSLDEGKDETNPIMRQYMEKHVPMPLWKTLVKNFLVLMRQGRDPQEVQQLFPMSLESSGSSEYRHRKHGSSFIRRPQVEDEDYFDNLSNYDNNDTFGTSGEEDGNGGESDDEEEAGDYGADAVLAQAKALKARQEQRKQKRKSKQSRTGRSMNARSGSRERERSLEQQQRALAKQTHDYYRQVKTVPSRLGEVIKHDRQNFQHARKANDSAAFDMIAKQRADHFMKATTPPVGLNNPVYQLDRNSLNTRSQVSSHSFPSKLDRRKPNYYHDLDSGAAAMDIANGFLSSSIGHEIMSMTGSELDEDLSLSPAEAMEKAKRMLGIPSKQMKEHKEQLDQQFVHTMRANRVVVNSSSRAGLQSDNQVSHQPHVTDSAAGSHDNGFTTVRERQIQQKLDAQSKHLYGSNWKAPKTGGWAADFGPAHTHAFYTGPEKSRLSFSSSLTTGPAMTTSSTTATILGQKKPSDRGRLSSNADATIRQLSRSTSDLPTFTKLDPVLGKMIYAATDGSVSSTSFDIAIAGAGADANTGIYDDDSLSGSNLVGDDKDEALAAKFRESVSLREIAEHSK